LAFDGVRLLRLVQYTGTSVFIRPYIIGEPNATEKMQVVIVKMVKMMMMINQSINHDF